MKPLIISLLLLCFGASVVAQPLSPDASRLADRLVEQNWKVIENLLPAMLAQWQKELEQSGATNQAAATLGVELKSSLTKENFSKGFSKVLSQSFSPEEIGELERFYSSPLAQKFADFSGSSDQGVKAMDLVLKAACESSRKKLGAFDRGSINSLCGKY